MAFALRKSCAAATGRQTAFEHRATEGGSRFPTLRAKRAVPIPATGQVKYTSAPVVANQALGHILGTHQSRANLPESLRYLESPGLAGRGKSDRLAKMYLTLNEACHRYSATGTAANSGLVRAAYRNLDQLADD